MRFLSLGFRRPSPPANHEPHVVIHSWSEMRPEIASMDDEDAAIDAFLRELDQDPLDVLSRICVPVVPSERESSPTRVRRVGKPRGGMRRRVAMRG